jgi:hypothetical protein
VRIGIDLDNTIIDYQKVFALVAHELGLIEPFMDRSKKELRDFIRRLEGGELRWQQIQAQVYGPRLAEAEVMEGFREFLVGTLACGHDVFILSHKTRFAAQDKDHTCDLREVAINWLKENEIVSASPQSIPEDRVLFFDDRSSKIADIARLGCDLFVDDLPEIFADENFPKKTVSVRIGSASKNEEMPTVESFPDWKNITTYVNETFPVDFWVSRLSHRQNISDPRFFTIEGGLNSRGCKVENSAGKGFYLKKYRDDRRNRRENECNALKLLKNSGFQNTPSLIDTDEPSNSSIFSWIEGDEINPVEVKEGNMDDLVDFFVNLQNPTVTEGWDRNFHASEACFSLDQIISNLNERHNGLSTLNIEDEVDQSFANWVSEELSAVKQDLTDHALRTYRTNGVDPQMLLPNAKRILSPSDFGFHNCLMMENGKLCFLDFEYFGWDDPVKTLSDFILHPHEKMCIEGSLKMHFEAEFRKSCVTDEAFDFRFEVFYPLYALKWVYIQSNIFLREGESKVNRLTQFEKIQSFTRKHTSVRSAGI